MTRKLLLAILFTSAIIGSLTGCSGSSTAEAATTDEVPMVSQEGENKVVAEGVIEPARWSELSFDIAGDVVTVLVEEGDSVSEGDPLIQLETADLERALTQAEISLRQAQVRLEKLQDPPDEVDLGIARSAVSNVAAAYQEAKTNLMVTGHSVSVGDAVRATRAARDETHRVYQHIQAKKDAGQHYDETRLSAVHDAYLDALGAYNRAVENAGLQMTVAQNGVARAYHAVEQAQNELDKLLEGADDADLEAAQLDVEAARLAIKEAQSNMEETTLIAPFDGVVAVMEVEHGDTVAPGQVMVVMATLDELQVRTTDLTELDVVQAVEGQSATVTVDALPGETFAGRVSEIARRSGDYRGDVVYAVTVGLTDEANTSLRWGMTALVEIEAN